MCLNSIIGQVSAPLAMCIDTAYQKAAGCLYMFYGICICFLPPIMYVFYNGKNQLMPLSSVINVVLDPVGLAGLSLGHILFFLHYSDKFTMILPLIKCGVPICIFSTFSCSIWFNIATMVYFLLLTLVSVWVSHVLITCRLSVHMAGRTILTWLNIFRSWNDILYTEYNQNTHTV